MKLSSANLAYKVEEHCEVEELVNVAKGTVKKNKVSKFFVFMSVLYAFSLIVGLLIKTACITEQKTNLTAIKCEYEMLLNDNKKLEVGINSKIDLRRVEEIAIGTLNMNKPKKNQIVYLNTKPNDYGEVISYHDESRGKTNFISGIIESLTGIFAYSN